MKIRSFLTFLFMFMLSLTGRSQNIDTGAVYELHVADGLVLDNQGKMRTALQWTTDYGNANQLWIAKRLANGKYTFTCKASGMNLGLRDAAQFGEPVWQVEADETKATQQWTLVKSNVKVTMITPKTSSKNDW